MPGQVGRGCARRRWRPRRGAGGDGGGAAASTCMVRDGAQRTTLGLCLRRRNERLRGEHARSAGRGGGGRRGAHPCRPLPRWRRSRASLHTADPRARRACARLSAHRRRRAERVCDGRPRRGASSPRHRRLVRAACGRQARLDGADVERELRARARRAVAARRRWGRHRRTQQGGPDSAHVCRKVRPARARIAAARGRCGRLSPHEGRLERLRLGRARGAPADHGAARRPRRPRRRQPLRLRGGAVGGGGGECRDAALAAAARRGPRPRQRCQPRRGRQGRLEGARRRPAMAAARRRRAAAHRPARAEGQGGAERRRDGGDERDGGDCPLARAAGAAGRRRRSARGGPGLRERRGLGG
mmetsp:Transcript_11250/g.33353  ORF Transcript_11250/g.33353 Transcript_11250/m.33353 type:complete len:358 (-) Transcript_11250:158-1231(-)